MWIVSYLAVLCVPLFFTQALYLRAAGVIEQSVHALNETELMRTQDSLDRIFENIRASGREVMMRQQVESLLYASKPLSAVKLGKIGELQDDMRVMVAQSTYVSDIYVLFNNPQIVTSTKEFFGTWDGFDRHMRKTFGLSAQQIEEGVCCRDFQLLLVPKADGSQQAGQMLVLMRASAYPDVPDVACVMVLRMDRFLQALMRQAAATDDASLLWAVSDKDGLILCTNETITAGGRTLGPEALQAACMSGTLDKSVVLTNVKSELTGLRYLCAVSAEQYTAPLRGVQRAYLLYLALGLALGLAASVVFARRHYQPVKRLGALLKIHPGQAPKGEFAALEGALQTLLRRESEQASRMREQQQALRQAALVRMLRGRVHSTQLLDSLCADCGMLLSTRRYLFIGILVRDPGSFFAAGDQDNAEDDALLRFLITSVTEEIVRESADCYACAWEEDLYCLVAPRDGTPAEDFERCMQSICAQAQVFILQRAGIRVSYYVGALQEGAADAAEAVRRAAADVLWGVEQANGFLVEEPVLTHGMLERPQEPKEHPGTRERSADFDAVMHYIGEHYADPNLSVAAICDHFSVSSSYLLKLFKRCGESGVLDCIHQQRVSAAKERLRETSATVSQIAEQVGYTNALALIRAFKRLEGVTPTAYRSLVNPSL